MRSLVVIATIGLSLVLADVKFIDLSHTFGSRNIHFPIQPPYNFSLAFTIQLENTVVVSNYYQTAEHSGTHMDAPNHFCPQGKFVSELALDKMSGPGVVIDLKARAKEDYDYQVSLQDVQDWEAKHGPIPKGAVVLLNFGWDKNYGDLQKVLSTDDVSNGSSYHFPGLGIEASRHIAGIRKVHAVGIDTPSADYAQSATYTTHINLLCDHGLIILENVANLDAMPTTGSHVYIGAIKLENGSGTPVRVFATVDDEAGNPSGSGETTLSTICLSVLFSMNMIILLEGLGLRM